jgi:hypothetical protein
LEILKIEYNNRIKNHQKPLIFGIQFHNGNHFYFIFYKIKLQKFIIADSILKNNKNYYIHSVLYLNYLINIVDNTLDLPFNSNDFKVLINQNIKPIVLNQTFNFNFNLTNNNIEHINSYIFLWKEFWQQTNLVDCGIFAWLLLYSL